MTAPLVKCDTHGARSAAVVCRHILEAKDLPVGFVQNSDDPDDLQAWCSQCEALFLEEGGLTPAFREFNDFRVVCDFCFDRLRRQNDTSLGP